MADSKISALSAASVAAVANELAINEAGTSKKISITQLITLLKTNLGMPDIKTISGSAYTINSTTATKVTALAFTGLVGGTYYVRWNLLVQSALAATSCKFGVNYTGTVTRMNMVTGFPSAGVTAVTGTWHNANNATTGQVWGYANTITKSTTAPNMGPWVAFTTANVDHFCYVEGVIVVSDAGDLELWCGSEATDIITLSIGSMGLLWRGS